MEHSQRLSKALTVLALGLTLGACLSPVSEDLRPSEGACQEDEPCWDCETMGNLICGDGRN